MLLEQEFEEACICIKSLHVIEPLTSWPEVVQVSLYSWQSKLLVICPPLLYDPLFLWKLSERVREAHGVLEGSSSPLEPSHFHWVLYYHQSMNFFAAMLLLDAIDTTPSKLAVFVCLIELHEKFFQSVNPAFKVGEFSLFFNRIIKH